MNISQEKKTKHKKTHQKKPNPNKKTPKTQKPHTLWNSEREKVVRLSPSDNLALFILTEHEPHGPTVPRGPQPICSHSVSRKQLGDTSLILTPIPIPSGWRHQGRFCDVITSHTRRLADTKVFKQVTQQAMTNNKSLWNYISPKGFHHPSDQLKTS